MGVLSLTSPNVISNARTNMPNVTVANIEELYTAVNDPQNADTGSTSVPAFTCCRSTTLWEHHSPTAAGFSFSRICSSGSLAIVVQLPIDAIDLPTSSFTRPGAADGGDQNGP